MPVLVKLTQIFQQQFAVASLVMVLLLSYNLEKVDVIENHFCFSLVINGQEE